MRSVLVSDTESCYVCGSPYVEEHHVIAGSGRRKVSDRYHLTIPLCRAHHEEVHKDRELYVYFARMGQEWYEKNIGTREGFIEEFGKSWL